MRYLLLLLLPIYVLHAYGEISTWRKREAPIWALAVMIISKAVLVLGMIAFVFAIKPASFGDIAFRITSVCIYFEYYFAFKSSPPKAETIAGKVFEELILALVILLLSGTFAFFSRLVTNRPETAIRHVLLFLLIAYLVARIWPLIRRPTSDPCPRRLAPGRQTAEMGIGFSSFSASSR